MPKPESIQRGPDDFFVLVRGIGELGTEKMECFLVRGKEAHARVSKVVNDLRERGKAPFPCIYLTGRHATTGDQERWKKAWETWRI